MGASMAGVENMRPQECITEPFEPSINTSYHNIKQKGKTAFLDLPSELVHLILSNLDAVDLGMTAQTCQRLLIESYNERLWQPILNANLPGHVSSPTPCKTFRELYIAYRHYWFLVKNRIWFGDSQPSGSLLIAHYDEKYGSIAAHSVVAKRGSHTLSFWEKDREVIIHSFDPVVRLDLHQPVVKLNIGSPKVEAPSGFRANIVSHSNESNYCQETLMDTFGEDGLYSSFMFTRKLPSTAIFDNTSVWPPLCVPSPSRTRNDTQDRFSSSGHRPTALSDVSQDTFRTRRWVEYTGRRSRPNLTTIGSPSVSIPAVVSIGMQTMASGFATDRGGQINFHVPEFITTFSTLPEASYQPTPQKPWQGIWCGDYSGHGCEFLLITQPDRQNERPLPSQMDRLSDWFAGRRRDSEASRDTARTLESNSSEASFVSAPEHPGQLDHAENSILQHEFGNNQTDDDNNDTVPAAAVIEGLFHQPFPPPQPPQSNAVYIPDANTEDYSDVPTGRLEGIKLTGDPNVPRGEYTFIAPDIGHGGFIRVADEEVFRGARVVRSAGHIAGRGFVQDQYTPSQLIMISHDRLAQYWEGFGHISFFQRVDIDALVEKAASSSS